MQTSKPLPDLLVPPSTDHGLPNLRFSFADAHMRLEPGKPARQAGYCFPWTYRPVRARRSMKVIVAGSDPAPVELEEGDRHQVWPSPNVKAVVASAPFQRKGDEHCCVA